MFSVLDYKVGNPITSPVDKNTTYRKYYHGLSRI